MNKGRFVHGRYAYSCQKEADGRDHLPLGGSRAFSNAEDRMSKLGSCALRFCDLTEFCVIVQGVHDPLQDCDAIGWFESSF